MPASAILSEIDAIFASKPVASSSRPLAITGPAKEATKKQNKQRTRTGNEIHAKINFEPAKRKAECSQRHKLTPESQENPPSTQKKKKKTSCRSTENEVEQVTEVIELFDPSVAIVQSSSLHHQHPHDMSGSSRPGPSKRNGQLDEAELAFRDSRGTRARTDDGLPIYSVEELKIGLGGETEACPFDCECCF